MKFMIMVFDDKRTLHTMPPEWAERVAAYMVRLDDELAQSGELVYSEVLEFPSEATVVDALGVHGRGSDAGLHRFWVVKVPSESRAIEISAGIAGVTESVVEVREVMAQSVRP